MVDVPLLVDQKENLVVNFCSRWSLSFTTVQIRNRSFEGLHGFLFSMIGLFTIFITFSIHTLYKVYAVV